MTMQANGLMKLGSVAAQNIAIATGMEAHAKTIETAIADEINAMSAHFTLAFADIQTGYEIELNKIKSEWTYVKANKVTVGVAAFIVFAFGVAVGLVI